MRLNKRACRKLADPTWKMNLNSGLFCADQLQYIVRSAAESCADRWNWINEPWPWQEGGC